MSIDKDEPEKIPEEAKELCISTHDYVMVPAGSKLVVCTNDETDDTETIILTQDMAVCLADTIIDYERTT